MPHYFENTPLRPHEITVVWKQQPLVFESSEGMFSKDRLDTGTRELLDNMKLPAKGAVLDLGCGIGVVGILVKKQRPVLEVTQTDVTTKAIMLAERNAQRHKVDTTVILSDCYDALDGKQFDTILVNPPRAAGKVVIERMIAQAPVHLRTGGTLQLVAMTNKGGKSYAAMMEEAFGNVVVQGRGSGFSVYCAVK